MKNPPTKKTATAPTQATELLARRRQELEARFDEVRRALDREIGWAPSSKTWALPVIAFASGLAIAAWVVARRRS